LPAASPFEEGAPTFCSGVEDMVDQEKLKSLGKRMRPDGKITSTHGLMVNLK
jgi:hypothetical protein